MRRRDLLTGVSAIGLGALLPAPAKARPSTWTGRRFSLSAARGLEAQLSAAAVAAPTPVALVDAARGCLWRGLVETMFTGRADAAVYERGQAFAEQCQRIATADAGGYFFEAIHRAKRAEIRGVVASVFELPTLQSLMGTVDRLAPGYGFGGTARFWGAVAAKTPAFLLRLKGSSLDEGDAYFRRAIQTAPGYAGNHVLRAPLLARMSGDRAARDSLRRAAAMPRDDNPAIEAWNRLYREQARRALAR